MRKICIILFVVFVILTFTLEGNWQLIAFLAAILSTAPEALDAYEAAINRCQAHKVETWKRNNCDDTADNVYQTLYTAKGIMLWLWMVVYFTIFIVGFFVSLYGAVMLFKDQCLGFTIVGTLIYLPLIMVRMAIKALFK